MNPHLFNEKYNGNKHSGEWFHLFSSSAAALSSSVTCLFSSVATSFQSKNNSFKHSFSYKENSPHTSLYESSQSSSFFSFHPKLEKVEYIPSPLCPLQLPFPGVAGRLCPHPLYKTPFAHLQLPFPGVAGWLCPHPLHNSCPYLSNECCSIRPHYLTGPLGRLLSSQLRSFALDSPNVFSWCPICVPTDQFLLLGVFLPKSCPHSTCVKRMRDYG